MINKLKEQQEYEARYKAAYESGMKEILSIPAEERVKICEQNYWGADQ